MATIQYLVNAVDGASGTFAKIAGSADGLNKQLDELGNKSVEAKVGLDGDVKLQRSLTDIDIHLARLNQRVTTTKMNDDQIVRASIQAAALNLQLDRLNDKRTVIRVDVGSGPGGILSRLSLLLGGHGAGATGGTGGPIGLIGGLAGGGGQAAGGAAGGTAAGGAGAGAALTGAAIGGGVLGLLAGIGGLIPALASATAALAAFGALALPTITKLVASSPGMRALKDVFASLVAALKPDVVHLFNLAIGILIGLLPQILPFADAAAKAFGTLLDGFKHFARSPEFGLFLNQMLKLAGPTITTIGVGLGQIAIAIGKLLIALVSPDSLKILAFLLNVVALAITALAKIITVTTPIVIGFFHGMAVGFDAVRHGFANSAHEIAGIFDDFRHRQAVVFDNVRHVFDDSVRFIQVWGHQWATAFDTDRHVVASWGHDIAGIFDTLRHNIASEWDLIWANTKNVVTRGIHDVVTFFGDMPGKILGALRGLGHSLGSFATSAFTEMWDGFKNVGSAIIGWLKGFVGNIVHDISHFLGMSPPHPGSAFWDLGANMMLHLEAGIKANAHRAANATRQATKGLLHPTGSGGSVEALMKSMAASVGWTGSLWTDLFNVEEREAGFNLTAQNPGSGAYGLAQFINGPSEYYQWGGNPNTAAGQITGMLNYIRARYGSPAGAWQSELTRGWYDRGGWLPTGLSLALNTTGRPERVGGGGGNTYNITITLPPGSDREQGRRIVSYIRSFEQGSGAGWRK